MQTGPGPGDDDPQLPPTPFLPPRPGTTPPPATSGAPSTTAGPVVPSPVVSSPFTPGGIDDPQRIARMRRRANPWHRRVARVLVRLGVVAVLAAAVYAGLQLGIASRERSDDTVELPAAGAEVPAIRSTSVEITSGLPGPTVDGTLTIDRTTGAFAFVGREGGPQSGFEAVSPAGTVVYVRQGGAAWRAAGSGDEVVTALADATAHLPDGADGVLTNRLRIGYVSVLRAERVDAADGGARTRFDLALDTAAFSLDFPLQWEEFRKMVVPEAPTQPAMAVSMVLDDRNVLVELVVPTGNWSWRRITDSPQPFVPPDPVADPGAQIVQVACVSAQDVFWQTPFASCDDALAVAEQVATDAGIIDRIDDLAGTTARLCAEMERLEGATEVGPAATRLAIELVAADVCRGDPMIFR